MSSRQSRLTHLRVAFHFNSLVGVCGGPHHVEPADGVEAGRGHHVAYVEQRLLDDDAQRLVQLDATQVDVERAVQALREAELRVVQHLDV